MNSELRIAAVTPSRPKLAGQDAAALARNRTHLFDLDREGGKGSRDLRVRALKSD